MGVKHPALSKYSEKQDNSGFANIKECQNKHYFKKQIQETFPEIEDEVMHAAIESTNRKFHENALTRRYDSGSREEIFTSLNDINGKQQQ